MAFPDIYPVRPVHLLIMPKKHIKDFTDFTNDSELWSELMRVLQKLIKDTGLTKKGYRLALNGGGAQLIDHLHIHLAGPVQKITKLL